MLHTISTSLWINIKNLRFFLLQYLMLVIIFPSSYLLISLASTSSVQPIEVYSIGLFTSMLFSLFINMQASMIANSNSITAIEQYATFMVRPLFVHMGGCVYHAVVGLPFFAVLIAVNLLSHTEINVLLLIVSMVLAFLFLSATAMVLGGLFRNPNIASPVINMLYMIIVMVTPFYTDLESIPQSARLAYCFNPFAHVTSLIGGSFGQPMLCDPFISAGILFLLTFILGALSVKRWYSSYAAEKLGVF
ncbi:MAG: ABC transporter permease [Clostridia bacterium]|nr:ABC transporter permease [Clostridia bacterium]